MRFTKGLIAWTVSVSAELPRLIPLALFGFLVFLLSSSPAWAQSCPLCKTALIGQSESTLKAINLGILVLLFPPLILMTSIVFLAFRQDRD